MNLRPQIEHTDDQAVLDYYLAHYSEVHIISCNSCGSDLGIEIFGQVDGLVMNKLGYCVLPLGGNLLSSRVRLDGSMGYQCGAQIPNPAFAVAQATAEEQLKAALAEYDSGYKAVVKKLKKGETKPEYTPPTADNFPVLEQPTIMCLNDTRATEIEEQLSPDGTFLPHEVHAIEQKQVRVGWKPKIKRQGKIEIHETFTRERIK